MLENVFACETGSPPSNAKIVDVILGCVRHVLCSRKRFALNIVLSSLNKPPPVVSPPQLTPNFRHARGMTIS